MITSFQAEKTEANLSFDVRFDPERRFHCLVGNNGVGKTHLIEHLARTHLWRHELLAGGARPLSGLLELFIALAKGGGWGELSERELRLAEALFVDGASLKDQNWNSTKLSAAWVRGTANWSITCPVVFVGARERGHTRNVAAHEFRLLGSREEQFVAAFLRTVRGAMGTAEPIEEPAGWIASRVMINPAFAGEDENDLSAVHFLLDLLRELDPLLFAREVSGDVPKMPIAFVNGTLRISNIPVDKLATGYISILKIFQEIVAGFSAWSRVFPGKWASLSDVDGVVFIDELEAHLHPRWQAKIVDVLKKFFPKATFFVTTHSPLIVRQTEPGEAIEIVRDGDRVTSRSLGSPRDWFLADVYAEAFHVPIPAAGTDGGEQKPLTDVMLDLSDAVRTFTRSKDATDRDAALALHAEVDGRLPADDPRRIPLQALRSLLG